MSSECCEKNCDCDTSNLPLAPFSETGASLKTGEGVATRYRIVDMDCPTEEGMIRSALQNRKEVLGLDFNLLERVLRRVNLMLFLHLHIHDKDY